MMGRPGTAALALFFALTVGFFCVFAPRFATASNFESLMAGYSFVAIASIVTLLTQGGRPDISEIGMKSVTMLYGIFSQIAVPTVMAPAAAPSRV